MGAPAARRTTARRSPGAMARHAGLFEEGGEGPQTRIPQPVFRKLSHFCAFVNRDSSLCQKKMKNNAPSNIYQVVHSLYAPAMSKKQRFVKTRSSIVIIDH
jgi:hypothetical protein